MENLQSKILRVEMEVCFVSDSPRLPKFRKMSLQIKIKARKFLYQIPKFAYE